MALVNAWPLNDGSGTTAADVIGSVDGTLNGTNPPAWVNDATRPNGAGFIVQFDATAEKIDLPSTLNVPASDFTICCWAKNGAWPTTGNDLRFISKASGVSEVQHIFMLGHTITNPDYRARARFRASSSGNTFYSEPSTP